MNIAVHKNDNCPRSKICCAEYCKKINKNKNEIYLLNLNIFCINMA